MKIFASVKFQSLEALRSLLIYAGILFLILCFTLSSSSGNAQVTGMEMASAIFIFVVGLNSFKTTFHFSLVNGVSRKTQFIGFLAKASIMAVALTLIDNIYNLIFSNFIPYSSLYVQLYFRNSPFSYTDNLLSGPAWSFLLYLMAAVLGYMICLLYYRSGLIMKLVISIAPPAFLTIGLPYLAMNDPAAAQLWLNTAGSALGLYPQADPYQAMITFFCCTVLFAIAGFMLMRRAPIKK